ncbi:MAG: 6-bladed beta-propeller [Armatimonadota bacterium]|nr:6-bladed beta-propeller [Armatimonadota bacterium]
MVIKCIVFVIVSLIALYPASGICATYTIERQFGDNSRQLFSLPLGLAVDSMGNMWVADHNTNEVLKINPSGSIISKFGSILPGRPDYLTEPTSMIRSSSGNIYVLETNSCKVKVFDSNGNFLRLIGEPGTSDEQLDMPYDIALGTGEDIFITEMQNSKIKRFSLNGQFLAIFGEGGVGQGKLAAPTGIAVNGSGNVLVTDHGCVHKFDASGTWIVDYSQYGSDPGRLENPGGIAIDSVNNFYVGDTTTGYATKFLSNGEYANLRLGEPGFNPGQFMMISAVAIGPSDTVYVADGPSSRIERYSSSGTHLGTIGSSGSGSNEMRMPQDTAVDSTGNVYITDRQNHRIKKYDSSGNLLGNYGAQGDENGQFQLPASICIANSKVYVSDEGRNDVQMFELNMAFSSKFGSRGSGDGQFRSPQGICADSSGNIYIADAGNDRIQKFSGSGSFLMKFGTQGSSSGQLSMPVSVAVNNTGYIYIGDSGNNRVEKFTSSGNFSQHVLMGGSRPGQVMYPADLALDGDSNLYVTEVLNHRIQRIPPSKAGIQVFTGFENGTTSFQSPSGIALDSSGNIYVADSGNNRVIKLAPQTGPNISDITLVGLTKNSIVVKWKTDIDANSEIRHGTTTSYGQTVTNATMTKSHSVTLTGLQPDTDYHFQIRSTDGSNNTTSTGDAEFHTYQATQLREGECGSVTIDAKGTWIKIWDTQASGGCYMKSNDTTTPADITLRFDGTAVDVKYVKTPTGGEAKYYVDRSVLPDGDVSFYSVSGTLYDQSFSVTGLINGAHTLTIKYSDPSDGGSDLNVDNYSITH